MNSESEADRVNSAWDRIEKWYAQNMPETELSPGASESDIEVLETYLKRTIPEGLKTSLMRHNGIEEGQWTQICLLSAEGIKLELEMWSGFFEADNDGGEAATCLLIDADNGGNSYFMVLKLKRGWRKGQIFFMDQETGSSECKFKDFAGYLEDAAFELEAGRYVNSSGLLILDD